MKRSTAALLKVAFLLLFLPLFAVAQIPREIFYQGVLTDSTGVPKADGTYSFVFTLYTDGTGTTSVGDTISRSLTVTRGLFYTALPFPTVPFDRRYWLEIVADGEVLSPRIPLSSEAYSIASIWSDTAKFALTSAQGFVDSARIAGTVPNGSVTMAKIAQTNAGIDQVIKWTGTGWAPRDDSLVAGSAYIAGAGLSLSGSTFSVANAGIVEAMIADAAVTSAKIADNAVGTTEIADSAVTMAKIDDAGAIDGQVLKWSDAAGWMPRDDSVVTGTTGPWVTEANNNIYYSNGRVGIGGTPTGANGGLYVYSNVENVLELASANSPAKIRLGDGTRIYDVGIDATGFFVDKKTGTPNGGFNFTEEGRVGINEDSATARLHVVSNASQLEDPLRIETLRRPDAGTATDPVSVDANGVLKRGLTPGAVTTTEILDGTITGSDIDSVLDIMHLTTNGVLTFNNIPVGGPGSMLVIETGTNKIFQTGSSEKYKFNIRALNPLAKSILDLRPVRFQWKEGGREDIGLVAEEVDQTVRDLVLYDKDGNPNGVKYDKLALYLLELARVQQKEISELRSSVDLLHQKLASIGAVGNATSGGQ